MLTLNLNVSYAYVAWLRVFQASGLAFLFVPISTISFAGIPPGKNNDASGLTNLARNIGGSVGTAPVTYFAPSPAGACGDSGSRQCAMA